MTHVQPSLYQDLASSTIHKCVKGACCMQLRISFMWRPPPHTKHIHQLFTTASEMPPYETSFTACLLTTKLIYIYCIIAKLLFPLPQFCNSLTAEFNKCFLEHPTLSHPAPSDLPLLQSCNLCMFYFGSISCRYICLQLSIQLAVLKAIFLLYSFVATQSAISVTNFHQVGEKS